MKRELNRLISVAKAYAEWGKMAHLPNTHIKVRTLTGEDYRDTYDDLMDKGNIINMYFSTTDSPDTWAIIFGGDKNRQYEVTNYSKSVSIPYDATAKELTALIDDATSYLNNHLIPNVEKWRKVSDKDKELQIEALERQIEALRNGDTE